MRLETTHLETTHLKTTVGPQTSATGGVLAEHLIRRYREDGFVHLRQLLTPDEVAEYLAEAERVLRRTAAQRRGIGDRTVMECVLDVQLESACLRRLALHPAVTGAAEQLAGRPLRLFKQELLRKGTERSLPTGAHTDETALPVGGSSVTLSAWVALVDVPMERGCLSFLAGSHLLPSHDRGEYEPGEDLRARWPGSEWLPLVTVPVRAGDCTFHHGRTIHMAEANESDRPRISTIGVYVDADAVYRPTGRAHLDDLPELGDIAPGDRLRGPRFPRVGRRG